MARDRPWQRGKRKRPSKNELWRSSDGDRPSLLNFKGWLPFPPTIGAIRVELLGGPAVHRRSDRGQDDGDTPSQTFLRNRAGRVNSSHFGASPGECVCGLQEQASEPIVMHSRTPRTRLLGSLRPKRADKKYHALGETGGGLRRFRNQRPNQLGPPTMPPSAALMEREKIVQWDGTLLS
ncbi:hypothetical protein V2G26_020346 [Clonostachys chloroleuca]